MTRALTFDSVSVCYGHGSTSFTAVDDVSLSLAPGEILGLVGESGSGKSTLARAAVGLVEPKTGTIRLGDSTVSHVTGRAARDRRRIQMIFQDPQSCFDPRLTIGESLEEAILAAARREREPRPSAGTRSARVHELLDSVSLATGHANRMPAELSGGQRQRVAVARAIAARPEVILADEITSALDVSVQGSVLNLLRQLQAELGFSVLFISHNLAVVRAVCERVAVMRSGRLVEVGQTLEIMEAPREDYTRELIAAVPSL